jgi:hypothetical protein
MAASTPITSEPVTLMGRPGRILRSQPVAVLPEYSDVRIAPMRRFPLEPLRSGVQDARIVPT